MYKQFFAETCQATVSMVPFATQQRPHVFFYIPLVFEVSSCTDSLLLFKSRWKPFLFVSVKLKLTVNKTSRYKVILQDLNIHVNVFLPCCICCNNQWQYFSFHIDVHIFLLWMLSDTLWTKCFFVFLLLLPKYCSNKISSNDEWIWLCFFYILWVQKTKTLCFTFVSERTSLSHVCEEFCQIWYKCPLWLVDELIRIWWSKVRGQAHCDITFIPICVYNKQV